MTLLAVGSVAFDDLMTPSGQRDHILGGSASYFSLSASQSHPVSVIAVVGQDFGPDEHAVFRGRPIDLHGLVTAPGRSFHWKGRYGEDLNEATTLETHLNVFAEFQPTLSPVHRACPFLFLGNIEPGLQLEVIQQMASRPKWIALDTMNFWINGSKESLLRTIREVDILLVNEAEARSLTGERNLIQAYKRVREMGPSTLVVKRGEYGVSLFSPEGIFMIPAFPLPLVQDPTGAGDTFAGGFLGHLASKGVTEFSIQKEALIHGTIMASFTVEGFGTESLSRVTPTQIQTRKSEFLAMIQA